MTFPIPTPMVLAAAVVLGGGAMAAAQSAPQVDVQLGPAVQARLNELGPDELDEQRLDLQQEVARSLARSRRPPPLEVHLVIQDIEPNRPTSRQLGASAQLSASSLGLGGAAITGEVVQADGTRQPIRYRFFETQLRDERNFTTWGDADDAFDTVARDIAAGHPPNDGTAWPPPHRPRTLTGTRLGA